MTLPRDGSGIALEIARHTAKAADPNEYSLADPALGQDFETDSASRTLDDLDLPLTRSSGCLGGFRPPEKVPARKGSIKIATL
jgi:hypothetical protein